MNAEKLEVHVQEFFANAEKLMDATIATDDLDVQAIDVLDLLSEKRNELKKDYDDFAKAVASDSRVDPLLPHIAIHALCDIDTGMVGFNAADTNKNSYISKTEMINARSNSHFDPLQQSALWLSLSKFDTLRKQIDTDGFLGFMNANEVSGSDLLIAKFDADWALQIPGKSRAVRYLLKHFDSIDKNHNGLVSTTEIDTWLRSQKNGKYMQDEGLLAIVPSRRPTSTGLANAYLDKQDLKTQLKRLSDQQREFTTSWGR
jgi:Ca2+-binding EF-hand superfamily protein